jgi:hypothetical protein
MHWHQLVPKENAMKLFDIFKIGLVGGVGFAVGGLIYKLGWLVITISIVSNVAK